MENINLKDIPEYDTFLNIDPLLKGCGGDKKYYIKTSNNKNLLLRIADISEYDRKKTEFEMMKCAVDLGVPTSIPAQIGICNGGMSVYSLFEWCEGKDIDILLPELTGAEQYDLGVEAGEILRKINSIPAQATQEDWAVKFTRKTKNIIKRYRDGKVKADGGEIIIEYIENNSRLLENRAKFFVHSDYHTGNILIDKDNKLKVIDFGDCDFGDPWIEFVHMYWCSITCPKFAAGCINGYFADKPPVLFFKLLIYYVSAHALTSLYCADTNNQEDMNTALHEARYLLDCNDNMNNPIPSWYTKHLYTK